uniref:TELO2 interacting protein 2 n=1 Tax=Rhinopithecus bieti TaxID=61621 RepID=A0A2K6LE59_RHIBE
MELDSVLEAPSREESSLSGELVPSALGQALSKILHCLTLPEARRGNVKDVALKDLGDLIEATECDRLFEGSGARLRGMPETLGQVAKALESLEQPWNTPRSREVAREVLTLLLQATECSSVAGFLRGENEDEKGSLSVILGLLKPDLNKESWKNNPAIKHVFSWTLQQVTRPWLSQHLERVLPASLLISDDYQTENKILGVHCLHHIVLNVPAADLLQYNRAQVLYHAVFNHLYTPEYHLIQPVLLCLLDLFPILEKTLHWKGDGARPTTHCDEVLQLILTHMEPEHRLLLRRTYARNLPAFVKRLGILTVRHFKRLERVIIGYLEVYDGPEEEARLKILETLKLLMQHTWPRVSCRLVVLLKALLKLICDVARDPNLTPESVKSALLQEATDCLILLDRCSQGRVKHLKSHSLPPVVPRPCRRHEWGSCRCRHTEEHKHRLALTTFGYYT